MLTMKLIHNIQLITKIRFWEELNDENTCSYGSGLSVFAAAGISSKCCRRYELGGW